MRFEAKKFARRSRQHTDGRPWKRQADPPRRWRASLAVAQPLLAVPHASLKELHREERAIINVTQVSEYTGADLAEGNPAGDGCEAPSRHTRLGRIVCHVRTTGITTPRCRNSGPKRCSNPKSRSSNGKTALRSLVPF